MGTHTLQLIQILVKKKQSINQSTDINFLNCLLLLSPSLSLGSLIRPLHLWDILNLLALTRAWDSHSTLHFSSLEHVSVLTLTYLSQIYKSLASFPTQLNRILFPATRQPKLICSLNSFFTIFLRAHSQCGPRRSRS